MQKLSKNINSNFIPNYIGGYPIYSNGGLLVGYPMYGFGSWLKENAGTVGGLVGMGAGALIGGPMGAQIGSSIGGSIGGTIQQGDANNQQLEALRQQQQEQLKQSMVGNLPAQQSYVPTFATGGGLSRSEDYGSKSKPYPSVSKGDFAGGGRSYPIPTKADAIDALRLAGLHGRSDVRAKVFAKYPELKKAMGGELDEYASGGSIHINPANKGKFNATKKATGKSTEELTHSKNPLTRKRAIFAQNAAKWKHEDGGLLESLPTPILNSYQPQLVDTRNSIYSKDNTFNGNTSYFDEAQRLDALRAALLAKEMQTNKDLYNIDQIPNMKTDLYMHQVSKKAMGGSLDSLIQKNGGQINDRLNEIQSGTTHEQSPINGVPIGNGGLVEDGEFVYTNKKGNKYVFSNRF